MLLLEVVEVVILDFIEFVGQAEWNPFLLNLHYYTVLQGNMGCELASQGIPKSKKCVLPGQ